MADINDIRDEEEAGEDEIVQNINVDYWPVLTDPSPSVQPVRAWAVVDKDKNINANSCCPNNSYIEEIAQAFDREFPNDAPHRVIRVEIREVTDE
jgi:hypothetical protein